MAVTMPILKRICCEGKKYDDIVLLNINHDTGNSYAFSAELRNKFGKVIQIGASYSSSSESERKLFPDGIYYYAIRNRERTFSLQRSEVPLRIRTQTFIDSMDMLITVAIAKDVIPEIERGKKLFIIEDGGYHSQTVDNLNEIFPVLQGNIIGSVEQTTSGTKILSSRTKYNYPSFSIARSDIKMCLESVFIGQKIVEELSSFLAFANHFFNFSPVLLIGYGIFGRAVVKKLTGYCCDISVCDTDELIRGTARRDGYPAFSEITRDVFRDHQIVIAMTGNRSFGVKELEQYLESDADGIFLSSGSSKDIEYKEILDLIESPEGSPFTFCLEETGPYYEKYAVSNGRAKKVFYLIARGMPVNFCREDSISLTDKMIDLIFAEMTLCAAAIIESGNIKNGLYLLGDSDAPLQLDEWELMEEWFDINHLLHDGEELEQKLFIHPCRQYLRKMTYRKLAIDSLI